MGRDRAKSERERGVRGGAPREREELVRVAREIAAHVGPETSKLRALRQRRALVIGRHRVQWLADFGLQRGEGRIDDDGVIRVVRLDASRIDVLASVSE